MKNQVTWAVGIIGGLVTIAVAWGQLGWMTPEAHEDDLHQHQSATLSAIQAISLKIDVNRDEWRCDELSESLEEILSDDHRTPLDEEMVRRLRSAYDKNDCQRFEDE
jgi:hypothetical protein